MFKNQMKYPDRQLVSYHQSKQVDVCYIFLMRKALKFIYLKIPSKNKIHNDHIVLFYNIYT